MRNPANIRMMHQAALATVPDTLPLSMSHPQAFGRLYFFALHVVDADI